LIGPPADSPWNYAMRAKLSRTVAGMPGFILHSLLAFVLGPFLGQRLVARLALQEAEAALNHCCSQRF